MTKVLVCDDSQVERTLLSKIINKQGLEAVVVDSGHKAIDECKKQKFSLILLDLVMPGIDGWDTAKVIRGIDGCEEIPIIAISSITNKLDREKAFYCGINQLVAKPFEHETIVSLLNGIKV